MSSLVLLNRDGNVARKLQLVSLPNDYVVPEGMIVSWKTELRASSTDPFARWRAPSEPIEAFFYLGNAQGQVSRSGFREVERGAENRPTRFCVRDLVVTVQGVSAKNVMELRDRVMDIINSGIGWNVSNDLNPKPKLGILSRFKKLLGH